MNQGGETVTQSTVQAFGKSLRAEMKRSAHAVFEAGDRDPVAIIEKQNESRVEPLVPVRIGRMLQSVFAYYRGTAANMASDLSEEARTGIHVIGCGDAHVANFGLFAAPDRRVLFDLNDFDESCHMPWEWDVKRLAASIEVGFRHRGFSAEESARACVSAVGAYRNSLTELAGLSALERYYFRIEIDDMIGMADNPAGVKLIEKTLKKARGRTSNRVLDKITTTREDGEPRIVDQPPVLQHVEDIVSTEEVQEVLDQYRETLRPDISLLLSKFRLVDFALRVVGVGSVGTRCFIMLLTGPGNEPVFIQLKEAQPSVIETWGGIAPVGLKGLGDSLPPSHGYRVVSSQQVLQAASDPFLGWVGDVRGSDYFVRQFRDMKGSADLDVLTASQFERYGMLCARLLARAHSQSPGWSAIQGYLGNSDVFDRSIAAWSSSYADQVERDFSALSAAVKSGRLPCESGI
ncbi:MAG: DUF2252 domain-containing protein [Actinomycetota bacterium]|nr:DUF2252 domain-containing protein [Actinomycetota bacterium]